jgi:transposase-like protein
VRRSAAEKMEIIRMVDGADLPVRATLRQLGIPRSTFYGWYQRYLEAGFGGLKDRQPARRAGWNRIPKRIKDAVLELALERTELSPQELACRFTEELRYWKLSATMDATDVTEMLDQALAVTGVDQVRVRHRSRLLSDNGPAYVSGELREYLGDRGMAHTRGASYHPQTQGKIERWHRTMKNVVKLQHYHFPWELEATRRDCVGRPEKPAAGLP